MVGSTAERQAPERGRGRPSRRAGGGVARDHHLTTPPPLLRLSRWRPAFARRAWCSHTRLTVEVGLLYDRSSRRRRLQFRAAIRCSLLRLRAFQATATHWATDLSPPLSPRSNSARSSGFSTASRWRPTRTPSSSPRSA
jgi:hypothetical protein